MTFKRHAAYTPAPSPDSALWRYISLAKFLSLLQKQELYLSNLEFLARADPFEGTLPLSKFQHRSWQNINSVPSEVIKRLSGYLRPGENDLSIGLQRYKDLAELRIRQAYAYRRSYFISCWHISEHESAAMWEIYSKRDEGIAIVSSETRLMAALSNVQEDIFGGQITYEDYSSEDFVMKEGNAFTPILYKRFSFSHEKEYRLVYWDTSVTHKQIEAKYGCFNLDGEMFVDVTGYGRTTVGKSEDEIERVEPKPGHKVTCKVNEMIEKVYVSPLAEKWFYDVVKAAAESYELTAPIVTSDLLTSPLK